MRGNTEVGDLATIGVGVFQPFTVDCTALKWAGFGSLPLVLISVEAQGEVAMYIVYAGMDVLLSADAYTGTGPMIVTEIPHAPYSPMLLELDGEFVEFSLLNGQLAIEPQLFHFGVTESEITNTKHDPKSWDGKDFAYSIRGTTMSYGYSLGRVSLLGKARRLRLPDIPTIQALLDTLVRKYRPRFQPRWVANFRSLAMASLDSSHIEVRNHPGRQVNIPRIVTPRR